MIHHPVEVASNGMNVHMYPQDTDVVFLALRRTPLLVKKNPYIWCPCFIFAHFEYL